LNKGRTLLLEFDPRHHERWAGTGGASLRSRNSTVLLSQALSFPMARVATPFEKFGDAAPRIFSVPEKEVDKVELRKRKEPEVKRTGKPR
jgi:hypothetical protein